VVIVKTALYKILYNDPASTEIKEVNKLAAPASGNELFSKAK